MTRLRIALAAVAFIVVLGAYGAMRAPGGPRSMRQFDPQRLADLELRMWQAYYAKQNARLFALLVTMLREQYHYSWLTASREAFHLARAAATFADLRDDYEQVLPDLEAGYTTARDWLGASFDPAAVAKAELAWWVARRNPGQNDPDNVGRLIADEYVLLYDVPRETLIKSAVARARAGRMRDAQDQAPDWAAIRNMLDYSYAQLHGAVAP